MAVLVRPEVSAYVIATQRKTEREYVGVRTEELLDLLYGLTHVEVMPKIDHFKI
jgi:hypothetical protein